MGNSQVMNFNKNITIASDADFIKQLYFIQTHHIPCIGTVEIYRFKQAPYDYIMKHTRTFSHNNPSLQLYKQNLQQVATHFCHKNIVQIHYYKINTQFHMCGKISEVETYCNYYAITLSQIINKRKKDDIRFTANQIWYVLKSLLQISTILRKKSYNFGAYRANNITLSSQGYLKLYILHLNKDFSISEDHIHNQYSMALSNRSSIIQNLPLPPEFLPSLKQGNLCFPFQHQKQDSFMIATVVLEMMIDESIKKYYSVSNDHFCVYKRSSVAHDLGLLGYVYDKNYLIPLLQKLLCEDPISRMSPENALQFINQNRDHINIGGSLRMFEDDQNHIKPKISYRTSFDFQSNVLKTLQPNILQNKLTACPIKTLSKRGNNKSIGVSLTSSKQSLQTKDKSLKKSRVINHVHSRGSSLSTKVGGVKRV